MFRDETRKVMQKTMQPEETPTTMITSKSSQCCSQVVPVSAQDSHHSESSSTCSGEYAFPQSFGPGLGSIDHDLNDQHCVSTHALNSECPGIVTKAAPPLDLPGLVTVPNVEILTQYLFEQIFMSETWLSLLPQFYSRCSENSALRYSVHAASLFLMANQTGDYTAASRARRSYGRSLRFLNTALGNHDEMLKDETICTILVLHLINVSCSLTLAAVS